ncbi:MAG: threonine synthase [Acidobacteriota bacterium]
MPIQAQTAVAGPTGSTLTHLECSITGVRRDADALATIDPESGRALVARYDLEKAAASLSLDALRGRVQSLWRYREVLPIRDGAFVVSLGEGWTPLLAAPRLGKRLGLTGLMVKDEGRNPTGSFKARGLSASVSRALELGARAVAVPTAGNAGAALSAYAARAGVPAHVAMPMDAPETIQAEVRAYGARLELIDGLIHDAGHWIAEGCREHGWFNMATTKEPYRLEGKKTMGYELWEQLGGELPDLVLYPTGGGTGLIGMWKAWDELEAMGKIDDRRPRLVAVQSTGCAPVVEAFERGADRVGPWPDAATLAPGIRVPKPFADDLILRAIRDTGGTAVSVEDEAILDAMVRLGADEGLDACPEGAATLAGLLALQAKGDVDADERIVLFNCGSGLKHPDLKPQG